MLSELAMRPFRIPAEPECHIAHRVQRLPLMVYRRRAHAGPFQKAEPVRTTARLAHVLLLICAAAVCVLSHGPCLAIASPSSSQPCVTCHSGADVPVSATLANNSEANATYNVSAPGADAIAAFEGSKKLSVVIASSGQVTVPDGGTYTLYAVRGPSALNGIGHSAVRSPAAPKSSASYVWLGAVLLLLFVAGGLGLAMRIRLSAKRNDLQRRP
jgi:hypothetical protein